MVKGLNNRLFNATKQYIPGGVNSPVRAFRQVGGAPVFIKSGSGSRIYSEDGRQFIDYCLSWGALILGHAHPLIVRQLKKATDNGTAFGAATKLETELAKLITEAIPSMDKVRLTTSGTEAVMGAIRLSRAYTRKDKIIKFAGSYHGHADYLLDCPGVPADFKKYTIVLPYNDIKKAEETAKKYQRDIAAMIVEPVAANMGVVLPQAGFLESLRRSCDRYNIILIFDEVITGFRIAYGGAQNIFKVRPDLTCLAKIIGGGLPAGAYGGRSDIMRLTAPEGNVYQAGTFSGNPLSVTAGIAALKTLKEKSPYARLNERTREICARMELKAQKYGVELQVNRIGSMFSLFFSGRKINDYAGAKSQNTGMFKKFFHALLKEKVYFSPSGLEANFLSTAHRRQDIEKTLDAVDKAFKDLRRN